MRQFLDLDLKDDAGGGIALDEIDGGLSTALEIEDGFCWDHGYHLGPQCPRCRLHNGLHAQEPHTHSPRDSDHEGRPSSI